MKHTQIIACLVLALAACKSSDDSKSSPSPATSSAPKKVEASPQPPASPAVPCETGAPELAKLLVKANGLEMNLSDPQVQKEIAAAKASVLGKRYAFKGCFFKMLGEESVSFAGAKDGDDIECNMAGGEEGASDFRFAAMNLDEEKLRLDVTGTIAAQTFNHVTRLELTECTIAAHE